MKNFTWPDFYKFTKGRPPWPLLVNAVSFVTHKERALELGSGAGRDTVYLLEQGFHVTAVDKDPHAIAILAELPQQNLRLVQSAFEDFQFERGAYDLVSAQFALPFTAKGRFGQVFGQVKDSLRPGGIFVGQLFGVHDEWNTPGSQMTFLTREQAEELLKDMRVIEFNEEDVDGHVANGAPKHWHAFHIIAQKRLKNGKSSRANVPGKGAAWTNH
ncbi:MAG TPA: class I SAM-dependent methyltransferase [Ktedonobacteraceae bacterium]|nr:class I SAM-dependent methyltransferase [Ktedonobacteraceae bacterium]